MRDDVPAGRGAATSVDDRRTDRPDAMTGRLVEGRYRIGPRIARGGMATVYEALDTRLDRTVAVKVMHPGLDDASGHNTGDGFAVRLAREARAAARLSHPNVVGVFDQGRDDTLGDGAVYLAMELVRGHTLREVVREQAPMPPARALALLEPVLSALSAAHRAGLVHRDVKPENVLIADDGRVKVADFGLARAVSADTRHTATSGVLIGTVAYLAPELVVDGTADARADVYAVGVMLYELLTGDKPHQGETPIAVAYKHVHLDVPPPSARVASLPPYVDALVARATARDRTLRPADAGVLLHQVHRVMHALADGAPDDVELTADLQPMARHEPEPGLGASDTSWLPELTPVPVPSAVEPEPRPEPGGSPRRPDGRPAKPPRTLRSRRGPILLVLALLVAAAVGGGAYWFGYARYTTAPGVVSLDQSAAEQRLDAAGLSVAYADPQYSSSAAQGTVIAADPASGARILPDSTVTLTLSLGRDSVPSVRGLVEDDAQHRLLDRQLRVADSRTRYSEKVAEGTVITASPAPGSPVEPGTEVTLVVSKGRRPIPVGNWVHKDADRAVAALTDRKLAPSTSTDYSDSVAAGRVISQTPAPGTDVHKGDAVQLVVSQGPHLVAVPSVRGYGIEAAKQTLTDAGFRVEVTPSTSGFGYLGLGFAAGTDPEAGSLERPGTRITIYEV